MNVRIAGAGWVTPLGYSIPEVWDQLLAGRTAEPELIRDPLGQTAYPVYRVPANAVKQLPAHPRLRRASAISRFAASAGLAALADANLTPEQKLSDRLALIFAVANGGVIYTKRFYSDIVNTGADAASPLLFPETVFNAAASHLAAIIGLTGITYTLVADGSVGLTAMKMAEELLVDPDLDYCLIVAAEEADWLLCDAYRRWRLLRPEPPIEVYGQARGTILSEGAGALVLGRTGSIGIAATVAGEHFRKRTDAPGILARALQQVGFPANATVITSANGTFIDRAELEAIRQHSSTATLYSPKISLGEGVAARALWQVIVARQALLTGRIPAPQHPVSRSQEWIQLANRHEITVLSCGLNQQTGAARLVIED